ncbi:hypothetical protein GOL33_17225 [Sinorhizobium medicae]|nr:hypothetical protein [Sinorhizobium medicae]
MNNIHQVQVERIYNNEGQFEASSIDDEEGEFERIEISELHGCDNIEEERLVLYATVPCHLNHFMLVALRSRDLVSVPDEMVSAFSLPRIQVPEFATINIWTKSKPIHASPFEEEYHIFLGQPATLWKDGAVPFIYELSRRHGALAFENGNKSIMVTEPLVGTFQEEAAFRG